MGVRCAAREGGEEACQGGGGVDQHRLLDFDPLGVPAHVQPASPPRIRSQAEALIYHGGGSEGCAPSMRRGGRDAFGPPVLGRGLAHMLGPDQVNVAFGKSSPVRMSDRALITTRANANFNINQHGAIGAR